MKRSLLIGAGILTALMVATAVALVMAYLLLGKAVTAPGDALERLLQAGLGIFQNKTQISITAKTVTITPISEIALMKQTLNVHTVYTRSWYGSECVVVAEQEFIIKYGYDTKTVFTIMRQGSSIEVPMPRILSVEPTSGSPTIIYRLGGAYNKVSPDDILQIGRELHAKAHTDKSISEMQGMIKQLIVNQLDALRKEMGER